MSGCVTTLGGKQWPLSGPTPPPPVEEDMAIIGFGNNSVGADTTTRYMTPWYSDTLAETDAADGARVVVPAAGTVDRLYLRHGDPLGNGGDIVYTVRKNGVATAVTVTLASTGAQVADLVNSIAVAAGDNLDIEVTKAVGVGTSPGNVTAHLRFTPT